MASAAHEYYKLICGQSDPFTYLNNLPAAADPVTENEWRDFKEYHAGSREKGCRDAWSEALTAFANTEGGVVVWGLTAKREKGIDRVTESHP